MTTKDLNYCNNLLDTFISDIPTILFYFQRSEPSSKQWVTLGLIQRLFLCCNSLKQLLQDYEKNNLLEFSIGILIRPIILDALSSLRFIAILKKNDPDLTHELKTKEIEKYSNSLLSDGIVYNLDYAKTLFDKKLITIDELQSYYNFYAINYPDFLIQSKGINTKPILITEPPSGARSNFKSLANDSDLKVLSHKLFDLYSLYSKYDHFDFMHFELMNIESHHKEKRIITLIEAFVGHYYILADIFSRVTPSDEVVHNFYLWAKYFYENTLWQ